MRTFAENDGRKARGEVEEEETRPGPSVEGMAQELKDPEPALVGRGELKRPGTSGAEPLEGKKRRALSNDASSSSKSESVNWNGHAVVYPMSNRGDYTTATSQPLFLQALTEAFTSDDIVRRLRDTVPRQTLEQWSHFLARCYLQDTRKFHSLGHVMKLCEKSTPVQKIATLFHDVAYFQEDNGPPPDSSAFLGDVMKLDKSEVREHIYIIDTRAARDPTVKVVMTIFAVKEGQKLDPTIGLNEFASAVIGARLLLEGGCVPLDLVAEICACVEGTIPFRTNQWAENLYSNLLHCNKEFSMCRTAEEVAAAVEAAVELGNRDVGDFSEPEVLHFLDGTWDLLVENNPRIWVEGKRCPVLVFRSGLQKTHGFLSTVATELIFSNFRGFPSQEVYSTLSNNAIRNVDLSRIYSGLKLVLCLVAESLEVVQGKHAQCDPSKIDAGKDKIWIKGGAMVYTSPEKRGKDGKAMTTIVSGSSCSDVARLLVMHRTVKFSCVDGALSFLGKILLEILEGDLDRLEGLIANLKEESRHFPPYRALSEKVAKAIIRRCPQKLVDQVGTVFGM